MELNPCKDWLTNLTAPAPQYPGKCCDGLKSLYENAPICLCRIAGGDLSEIMSAKVDLAQFFNLPVVCDNMLITASCDGKFKLLMLYHFCALLFISLIMRRCEHFLWILRAAPVPPLRAAPSPDAAP
jgi:hypothetical protein